MFNEIALYILLIFLFSISPLPSLPIIIASYSKLGFLTGFVANLIAANVAFLLQYLIGVLLKKRRIKLNKVEIRLNKFSTKLKSLKFYDLLIIKFSNLFITKIFNLAFGFSRYPFKKLVIINNIVLIPWQFLYYFFASKVDLISEILLKINISFSISRFFSIISISCLLILSSRIVIVLLRKFLKNRFSKF